MSINYNDDDIPILNVFSDDDEDDSRPRKNDDKDFEKHMK